MNKIGVSAVVGGFGWFFLGFLENLGVSKQIQVLGGVGIAIGYYYYGDVLLGMLVGFFNMLFSYFTTSAPESASINPLPPNLPGLLFENRSAR